MWNKIFLILFLSHKNPFYHYKYIKNINLFKYQILTFEVSHKPGYQLQMRMGIHSGGCVAGVVGTKIPHYSVFGETVEIAGLMESSGESMKIQVMGARIYDWLSY